MNKPVWSLTLLGAAALFLDTALSREIEFSGYTWIVKRCDEPCGPGPNYFCDGPENVWVDSAGQLHLRITHTNGAYAQHAPPALKALIARVKDQITRQRQSAGSFLGLKLGAAGSRRGGAKRGRGSFFDKDASFP